MMRMVSVDMLQSTLRSLFRYGVFTPKHGRTGLINETSLVRNKPSMRMIDCQSSLRTIHDSPVIAKSAAFTIRNTPVPIA